MNDFAQQLRGRRNAHRHDGIASLGRGQLVADGTDAADARGDTRHLVKRAAFGELLEAADLRHLKLGISNLAGIVELNGDLAMAFDAAYRLNRNALHRRSFKNPFHHGSTEDTEFFPFLYFLFLFFSCLSFFFRDFRASVVKILFTQT
jgi:hypothetical protein